MTRPLAAASSKAEGERGMQCCNSHGFGCMPAAAANIGGFHCQLLKSLMVDTLLFHMGSGIRACL